MAFNHSLDGIAVTNSNWVIKKANPSLVRILGYSLDSLTGMDLTQMLDQLNGMDFRTRAKRSMQDSGWWQGGVRFCLAYNEKKHYWTTFHPILDAQGKIDHVIITLRDLEIHQALEEGDFSAVQYDVLTKLPNRTLFRDRLKVALATARRNQAGLAVLFLDLDNFKTINDSLGHATGDHLLKAVAQRLLECLREEDTVSRVGGDEFLVLLPGTESKEAADIVGRRILRAFERPLVAEDHELYTSFSIGIAIFPEHGKDSEGLIKKADMAMYHAKENGKHKCQVFCNSLRNQAKRRYLLEQNLRKGFERQEFVVHYQPKVKLSSGLVMGIEAVARWQRPELGLAPPREFIPLAEETGLIVPLGEWILKQACMTADGLRRVGQKDLTVSVNISARQLLWQHDFVAMVEAALQESGLPPHALELELTEKVIMHNIDASIEVMGRLKNQGVKISVDNFGTGLSSLRYLKKAPIDIIKIDRSFIQELPKDPSVVLGIISLAKELGLTVVAAGVEYKQQMEFLYAHGCEFVQGYAVSPALPAETLITLLKQESWRLF
ncbi:putative bifunctional diguanylate cyclase/phosphodiesterase [Dethiosulfatarculus sandiegensis]|nr:EAL domain-containing protein [Dethiosulfatarculus sandiegensis]